MEYIQCPHCQKKYGVSDKLRSAVGKRIRCKQCDQPFSIFIQEATSSAAQTKQHELEEKKHTQSPPELKQPSPPSQSSKPENKSNPSKPSNHDKQPDAKSDTKEPEEKQEASSGSKKKSSKKKKRFNLQLMITSALAGALAIAGIVLYLFYNNPELFTSKPDKKQSLTPELTFGPADPFAKQQQAEKPKEIEASLADKLISEEKNKPAKVEEKEKPIAKPEKAVVKEEIPPQQANSPKEKEMLAGPDNPNQVCKDAAADYWIRTFMISNTHLTSKAYLKLFNQGLKQTDQIRSHCKDKSLVRRLTDSAKLSAAPDWIRKEIDDRTSADEDDKKEEPQ